MVGALQRENTAQRVDVVPIGAGGIVTWYRHGGSSPGSMGSIPGLHILILVIP